MSNRVSHPRRNLRNALLGCTVAAVVLTVLTPEAPAATKAAPVRINAAGAALSTTGGHAWSGDRFAVGGQRLSTQRQIAGTGADDLYRTARVGLTGYRVPVATPGRYRVTMRFAEIGGALAGSRVFGVRAEGRTIVPRVDVAAAVGSDRAVAVRRTVSVRDGVLNLDFMARVGQPLISALEVTPLAATTAGAPVTWRSGVYMPGQTPRLYSAFGAWRGRTVQAAVLWPARQTWSDFVQPTWLYNSWANTPGVLKVIGVPPFPENAGASMSACADGQYDAQWAEFGRRIKAAGLDEQTVVRLGWEFNGNWYQWSARNPAQFVQCWRAVVRAAESEAPALRWDWTVNRGRSAGLADARQAWPGNDYVDIVGIDSYDMWPAVTSTAAWQQQVAGPYGLNFWRDWAVDHGKQVSVPEWGVYPGAANNGGDNALYISRMHTWFRANAAHLAYESYFNESASYYRGGIFGPTQNPRAAAVYRALF